MTTITTCPGCGSRRFLVTESAEHVATVDEDGVLRYPRWPDDIRREGICCADCELRFSEEQFAGITHT